METFNVQTWRRAGGMKARYGYTSTGRRVRTIAMRPPRRGELYAKPSGIRWTYVVLTAEQDHAKHSRLILEDCSKG